PAAAHEAPGRRGQRRAGRRVGHAAAGARSARPVPRPAGRRTHRSATGAVPGRHRRGPASGACLMQNVNLYQPETPRRQGPSRRQMLLGLALLGGLLLAHGLWEGWHGVTTARALEQAELQARQAGFREPQLDPRLVEQLTELEAGNQRLQRLAEHLLALENRHREGFAPLLGGLADRHVPGLWLTRIRLEEGGEHIRLD